MSRRLALLAVLLVTLAGVVPAWACAAMAQQHDCCPDRKPCDSDIGPQLVSQQGVCCVVAPAPSPLVITSPQKDDSSHIPAFDDSPDTAPLAHVEHAHWSRGPPVISGIDPNSLGRDQLLYLRTGRLRL